MTLTEKVVARAAGLDHVRAGEEVWVTADRMIMNDSSGPRRLASLVEELGGLWAPERVVVASDHFVPASNVRHAEILKTTRDWSNSTGVHNFFEYEGILHSLVLQDRLVHPGMLLVGADSHTTTAGAMGAVAVAVGSTELATVLATGQLWLRVPDTVHIDLSGLLSAFVDMRDVTMMLLGALGSRVASYRAIEYAGSFVDALAIEERLVLTNQGVAMGAKNAVVVPTDTLEHDLGDLVRGVAPATPDADAHYAQRHHFEVSKLEPLVALPPSPANIAKPGDVADVDLHMAWIGSCVGGRGADLRAAAEVVAGRQVRIPLLVNPATRAIYQDCANDGTLATLVAAGATIMSPGCGACAGVHAGVQGPGDRVIATATRNFAGRMGSRDSQTYLGSAYTVAASALRGRITDPREVMQ
jgi:3-isopropylmalate/(R)-2-methylmalate dehydratase large subunit